MITKAKPDLPLEGIRATIAANHAAGRGTYDGLESSEIGRYNRALMFGDNDEAFPDQATWARITD